MNVTSVSEPPIRASTRRIVAALALVSLLLTIGYGSILQPDWESYRDDQVEYLALAHGLLDRGEFTRAAPGESFVPEPLRTPGYPLLRAGVCVVAGCGPWPIAIVQGVLFAALAPLTLLIARRALSERAALAAAIATTAYLPFAYFAAIPLSDLPATTILAAAVYATIRAHEGGSGRWAAAAGALLGALALTRPTFVLLPAALVGAGALAGLPVRRSLRRLVLPAVLLLVTYGTVLAPFLAYSYRYFGGPFASSSGTGLWYGYVQGLGGGTAAELTAFRTVALASAPADDVGRAGAAIGFDPVESVEAAAALREITTFNAVDQRLPQAYAWITLNASLARHATTLIGRDPVGWLVRGVTVRSVELWSGEEPYRVRDALRARPLGRIPFAIVHLWLLAAAIAGAIILLRGRAREGLFIVAIPAYVWATSFPFVTEARYALPAMPFVLIGAVAAADAFGRRTRARHRAPAR